jgi:hypothetical protein
VAALFSVEAACPSAARPRIILSPVRCQPPCFWCRSCLQAARVSAVVASRNLRGASKAAASFRGVFRAQVEKLFLICWRSRVWVDRWKAAENDVKALRQPSTLQNGTTQERDSENLPLWEDSASSDAGSTSKGPLRFEGNSGQPVKLILDSTLESRKGLFCSSWSHIHLSGRRRSGVSFWIAAHFPERFAKC